MKHLNALVAAAAFMAGTASTARAQFTLSELLTNPSPGTDDGQEGVEIRGPASASLAGYWLMTIEGDGTTQAGTIDVLQDLGAYTTGANGHLLIRDAGTVILPNPDAMTSVVTFNWTPDIENGTNTYILGSGTPPAAGTDIDADDNDAIDGGALTGFTVVDAVTILDSNAANSATYADDFVGGFVTPAQAFVPEGIQRIYNADGSACNWVGGDINGTNPGGPYDWVIGPNIFGGLSGGGMNLGTANLILDADMDGIADGCEATGTGTPFCFGDGSLATACPCANVGQTGRGCANSIPASPGALLVASGMTSPDTVTLNASDMLPTASNIYLMGSSTSAIGIVFGDGLRCAAGQLLRLAVKTAVGGASQFPDPNVADPSITAKASSLGFPIQPGATHAYQTYYRDPDLLFCPPGSGGNSWNVTNGILITWP